MAAAKPPLFVQAGMLPATQLELTARVGIWREAAERFEKAQAEERALRADIIARWFDVKEEGTHTGSLSNGYNLKAGIGINRKVDQEQVVAAYAYAREHKNNYLLELLDKLFRVKYELNLAVWRALDADDLKRMGDIVTEDWASPSLKYEERK